MHNPRVYRQPVYAGVHTRCATHAYTDTVRCHGSHMEITTNVDPLYNKVLYSPSLSLMRTPTPVPPPRHRLGPVRNLRRMRETGRLDWDVGKRMIGTGGSYKYFYSRGMYK